MMKLGYILGYTFFSPLLRWNGVIIQQLSYLSQSLIYQRLQRKKHSKKIRVFLIFYDNHFGGVFFSQ